jgi:hypothetical protein
VSRNGSGAAGAAGGGGAGLRRIATARGSDGAT